MREYEFKNLVSNQNQSNNEKKMKRKKTETKVDGSWHVRRHL
jgi:hypothetical protein